MKLGSRNQRAAVAVTGVALLTALGAGPALAQSVVPAAGSETVATSRPDIRSAVAVGLRTVRVCFDSQLATTFNIDDGNFYLEGYGGDSALQFPYLQARRTGPAFGFGVAGNSSVDPSNSSCALVNFNGLGDVRSYSRVVVDSSAVTDVGGSTNIRGGVALTDSLIPSPPGRTSRPDIVANGIIRNPDNTITYRFDEPLSRAVPGLFGFYTNNGADAGTPFHGGISANGFVPGDTEVTVTFSAGDIALMPTATRFVARRGAVQDMTADDNPMTAAGGDTPRPELQTTGGLVTVIEGGFARQLAAFDFDQSVLPIVDGAGNWTAASRLSFVAYDAAGNIFVPRPTDPAPSFANGRLTNGGRRVLVDLVPTNFQGDDAQLTLFTAEEGAVVQNGGALTNSDGSLGVQERADRPGLTSGPDLIRFAINRSTGAVTYFFDAPLDPDFTHVNGFGLIMPDGGIVFPPNTLLILPPGSSTNNNSVTVAFAPLITPLTDVQRAVGVIVREDDPLTTNLDESAVEDTPETPTNQTGGADIRGYKNPTNSLGFFVAPSGTGNPPGQPPTTTPPPARTRVQVTSSISKRSSRVYRTVRRRGRNVRVARKLTVSGTVSSSEAACRRNRSIALYGALPGKAMHFLGLTVSKSGGSYRISVTDRKAQVTRIEVRMLARNTENATDLLKCSAARA
jgi:hypothetical protein